ncbi:MAG: Gfo/Idh/MocA family oxidoreductase [bacterium]
MKQVNRRQFLKSSISAGAAAAVLSPSLKALGANERIRIGLMGVGGRGSYLAPIFARLNDVEIVCLCDADSRAFSRCIDKVEEAQNKRPRTESDYRRMMEDKEIDAVINATPDHWHVLGTIAACQNGKDVYVEKPASHSIWEGRKMIEAARKYNRVVQLGTQTRSAEYASEAVELLRSGKIGKIHLVRVNNILMKNTLDPHPDEPVPNGLNYDMWLGAAPKRPFNRNHFQGGCWNWFWNYSGGDIINDGIHQMDFARWAIGQRYPKSVFSTGGIFHLRDGRDCPDTQIVTYDFDDFTMVFELAMWTPYIIKTSLDIRNSEEKMPDWPHNSTKIEIYGTDGMMTLGRHGGGYEIYGIEGEETTSHPGKEPTKDHIENFIQCMRTRKKPNADIEEGHLSTVLCHLGNISYRVGSRKLYYDGKTETFIDDNEANQLVKRTYREPWVVPEEV